MEFLHILQNIFSHLDVPTLKTCRFVCRKWQYCGATELQTRCRIILFFNPKDDNNYPPERLWCKKFPNNESLSLRDPENVYYNLIDVMQNSPEFPCNSFTLIPSTMWSAHFQNFLFSVGHGIRTLRLEFNFLGILEGCSSEQSRIMYFLKNLLINQTPNLENLRILFMPPENMLDEIDTWQNDTSTNLLKLSRGDVGFEKNRVSLPNLKHFSAEGRFPPKAIEEILNAAINLKSFSVIPDMIVDVRYSSFYHVASPSLLYFVEGSGRFRIEILKSLIFYPKTETVPIYEEIIKQHGNYLALEYFGFVHFHTAYELWGVQNFWPRVGRIITQILESCAASVKKLVVSPVQFLSVVKIPVMHNLRVLQLNDFSRMGPNQNDKYFPRGFSMATSFPNLKEIEVLSPMNFDNALIDRLETYEPVLSVECISVAEFSEYLLEASSKDLNSVCFYQKVNQIFPNAVIRVKA